LLGIVAGVDVNLAYISLSIILVMIFFVSLLFLKNLKEL